MRKFELGEEVCASAGILFNEGQAANPGVNPDRTTFNFGWVEAPTSRW